MYTKKTFRKESFFVKGGVLMNPAIRRGIEVLGSMLKQANMPMPVNRMKNGATMQNVDQPNIVSKNLGKKRPLFSSPMTQNSPYNTE
jgi:hypothetical protein